MGIHRKPIKTLGKKALSNGANVSKTEIGVSKTSEEKARCPELRNKNAIERAFYESRVSTEV